MSMCPKADQMENGLKAIINELMGLVWVDAGVNIPAMKIWEEDKEIEVIPIDRAAGNYQIDMRVGQKHLSFGWDTIRDISGTCGVYKYDWGDCNVSELAIAAGLVLTYYGHAMAE
jgi:hypothetical protein